MNKKAKNYPLYQHQDFTNFRQLITEKSKSSPDGIAFQYLNHEKRESITYRHFYQDVSALRLS